MRLQLSDVQSGRSVILFFFLNIPSVYTLQHTMQCVLFTYPGPLFSPSSPLPSFFSLCLIMDFCDVQRRLCCWSVLISYNGREQRARRGKEAGTGDMKRAESIILIKRASVMLILMRHTHTHTCGYLPLSFEIAGDRCHLSRFTAYGNAHATVFFFFNHPTA